MNITTRSKMNRKRRKAAKVRAAIKATKAVAGDSPEERAALHELRELRDKRESRPPSQEPERQAAAHMIDLAMDEVGYHEGKTGGQWNNRQKYSDEVPGLGWSQGQPWCATFMSWLALRAGVPHLFPSTASCDTGAAWFKARGLWSEYPWVGAQVFYGTADDLTHTGLVVSFDAEHIYTVEGNTNVTGTREGDGVYLKTRRRRDPWVVGYGHPDWTAR